ncbi:hypothetical protein [Intrasporangium calvum]|uniref:Uncharacterized protein n=1 Tax=Intrasporangium calvum (strain ATCC 23552 / DSM 43043 / JCM 3097 / NBRC 12989 / NCIMB 10167 / NRRL B-3866 / 7 KIP) TaxID=710696 RepID=E6S848_INTC7|nr:hypothetical protein [Intrasporangium calvum]ADU46952.1 hypothetical protein Intca_0403 [Intrasporangium calvum DSM 43043]
MRKNWLARTALIITLGAAPLALAIPASAATGPAPGTGLTGACNMLQAILPSGAGMGHAMTVDAPQGNAGMWRAVDVSGCS